MGEAVADPNSGKRFRLLQDEEVTVPVPLPQGVGQPPAKPPAAPPLAAVPEPEPRKQPKTLEMRVKQLEQENDQLVCALYYLQQELKELRSQK